MGAVSLPLALQKIENEYLLFAAAGLITLAAFVSLILVPALSSYGRVWEKAAAGVLSVFVLAALGLVGVVIGRAIVDYYNDIVNLLHGNSVEVLPNGIAPAPRGGSLVIIDRCQPPRKGRKRLQARGRKAPSTRSPRRSNRGPDCLRLPAPRQKSATPASP